MSVDKGKTGFLNRRPKKIEVLYDGGFLLPKRARDRIKNLITQIQEQIEKEIKNGIKSGERKTGFALIDFTDSAGNKTDLEFYINQSQEAFVLGPKIGEGSFGEVFIAQNVLKGTWHCMKRLEEGTLLEEEIDVLKETGMYLSSERIPAEEDSSKKGVDLLIGELIPGESLEDIIKKSTDEKTLSEKLSFEQAFALTISLAEAYKILQLNGYVHRDIKPANVMVDLAQQKCIAIDFGLTRQKGEREGIGGSPGYISLEALTPGHVFDFSDDLYGIGLTAGEIFSSTVADKQDYTKAKRWKSPVVEERRKYVEIVDNKLNQEVKKFGHEFDEKGKAIEKHQDISHVILGAVDKLYQKTLSKEQIALFKLIFNMTGPGKGRPTLNEAITSMHLIRAKHIETRIKNWVDEYPLTFRTMIANFFDLIVYPGVVNQSAHHKCVWR